MELQVQIPIGIILCLVILLKDILQHLLCHVVSGAEKIIQELIYLVPIPEAQILLYLTEVDFILSFFPNKEVHNETLINY